MKGGIRKFTDLGANSTKKVLINIDKQFNTLNFDKLLL